MKNNFYFLLFLSLGLFITSCQQDDPRSMDLDIKTGIITGIVSSPSGKTIACARVKLLNNTDLIETMSNNFGEFSLELPVGEQLLEISTGNGDIFKTEIEVTVDEDTDQYIGSAKLTQVGKMAYISGNFDKIEAIIVDELGYTVDQIDMQTLMTDSIISYEGLFLNCGYHLVNDLASKGVFDFIQAGGSVYASDFASNYLLGNYAMTSSCSDNRDNQGFMSHETLCTFQSGSVENRSANIVDADMAMFVGTSILEIEYDLPQWEMIQNYDTDFWDDIVTDGNNTPLMIRRSLPADWPVDKPFGNIYYTTFHNHHHDMVTQEIASILEYVILNL